MLAAYASSLSQSTTTDGDEIGGLQLAPCRVGLVDVGSARKPGDRDVADVGDCEIGVQYLLEDDPVPGTRTTPGPSRTSTRSRCQWPMRPRPNEIIVVMAIADGARLQNRCGTAPIR